MPCSAGCLQTIMTANANLGQVTQLLASSFDHVIGADASAGMIDQAHNEVQHWDASLSSKVEFVTSPAERITEHVEPGSIDFITAGTGVPDIAKL